jgi:hypothetical protein
MAAEAARSGKEANEAWNKIYSTLNETQKAMLEGRYPSQQQQPPPAAAAVTPQQIQVPVQPQDSMHKPSVRPSQPANPDQIRARFAGLPDAADRFAVEVAAQHKANPALVNDPLWQKAILEAYATQKRLMEKYNATKAQ